MKDFFCDRHYSKFFVCVKSLIFLYSSEVKIILFILQMRKLRHGGLNMPWKVTQPGRGGANI